MKKIFKITLFFFILTIFLVGIFYFFKTDKSFNLKEEKLKTEIETHKEDSILISPEKITLENEKKEKNPATYKIKNVPFTPQAPFAKWDFDHNEACEEAAILMVHYFYQGKSLTPEIADKEILGMVDYQKKNWKGHFDLEAREIVRLAKEYYGYQNPRVIYDATVDDIKKEIVKGNPVIIPTAGRLLSNPYYRQPGPLYHALVAIGYTESEIITNDPGTKRGKDYSYKYNVLLNAMHEWNNGDIYNGKKTIIVLR